MSAPIAIRDRRDLPFFMVRLKALQEIRNNISGPRRARAIGLYVLLSQIANEQRAEGEHQRLVATWDELARRGALSKRMLKLLSATLNVAGAARFETRVDPLRGSLPSLIHLGVQEGPWIGLTVATAHELADDSRVPLLPALGLLASLLEFCAEQRAVLGGLRAETTRTAVAKRVGCSTDTLDAWVKLLEAPGILNVTRRRGADGGHLANVWEIIEPDPASGRPSRGHEAGGDRSHGDGNDVASDPLAPRKETALAVTRTYPHGAPELPEPTAETALAEDQIYPHGETELPRPRTRTSPTDDGNWPPGDSATPGSDSRPLNALAGSAVETRNVEEQQMPQPPKSSSPIAAGGEGGDPEEVELCVELVRVLRETRGPAPGRRYEANMRGWHASGRRVLADHPVGKVLEAIRYLPFDQVVGTKVRGMPDLERHIEDLRHRAHAARVAAGARPGIVGVGEGLAWPEAKAVLMRAVQRHGAGAKQVALLELAGRDPLLARFVERVGWGALCQSPIEKQDYAYRTSWDDLSRQAADEEAAA